MRDNGIQFINITDPYNPLPIHSIAHGDAGYSLGGPGILPLELWMEYHTSLC